MLEGILWAVGAGVMLGLYALPEKYTKGYSYENTWFLFFLIALVVLPLATAYGLINNFSDILMSLPADVVTVMIAISFLWGVGVQLWSKAINYIGVSLGFSIFIGAVIIIGSVLPFIVDGLPPRNSLVLIMSGLAIILVGIVANGRAGILRKEQVEYKNVVEQLSSGKTVRGILIALVGGLFATGFSFANAVGVKPITEAVVAQGNPEWMSAIAIMFVIYLSGALYVIPYFVIQLCRNNSWSRFRSSYFGKNLGLTFVMAFFNYTASASFAYAAFTLGNSGNTVGYAIYNTVSVLLAVLGGILAGEWNKSSLKAQTMLCVALFAMILGVIFIALGNSAA